MATSPAVAPNGAKVAGVNVGRIVAVVGPVIDIQFPSQHLPEILNAIKVEGDGVDLTAEVATMRGDDVVRCIAMSSTDGLVRGMKATDTGGPITVPVGRGTLGRVFDLLGRPIDQRGETTATERWPIHRPAPDFEDQSPATEILETGMKVIDLICPFAKGGKIGLFGGAGLGKTVVITELIRISPPSTAASRSSRGWASGRARATTSGSK